MTWISNIGGLKPPATECNAATLTNRKFVPHEADYFFDMPGLTDDTGGGRVFRTRRSGKPGPEGPGLHQVLPFPHRLAPAFLSSFSISGSPKTAPSAVSPLVFLACTLAPRSSSSRTVEARC